MSKESEVQKRTRARGTAGARGRPRKATATPADPPAATPAATPIEERVERLAQEAVDAGRKLLGTDPGRHVADVAQKAFKTAEDVGREAGARAEALATKAMESRTGRDARETARAIWATPVGRNVAIGASAGAALGLFIPFVGPVVGAVVGGGLGYLRTITRKG